MEILSVTQINSYIKYYLDENPALRTVYVSGEVSNFLHYQRSGHFYFTIKDASSQLKCVMFASNSSRVRFTVKDGMSVICRGRIGAYERDGVYQLYVDDMQPEGIGDLALAFEQLKNKLSEEGLFDEERKKSLPKYPQRIGVVTSNMGAAVQDIKKILARRFPIAEVVLYPALVQGDGAAEDIAKGIKILEEKENVDVIIVGRGGGSIEDLWAFNTEIVARAVAECTVPIISAVGHETDFTICDFAADKRAATPSMAAEIAVPDMYSEFVHIAALKTSLKNALLSRLENERLRLDKLSRIEKFTDFSARREKIDYLRNNICKCTINTLSAKRAELVNKISVINALNPMAVMERGFAVAKKQSKVVTSVSSIAQGDKIEISFHDGAAEGTVDKITECETNGNDI